MINQQQANYILQHLVGILSQIYPGTMGRANLVQILCDASPTSIPEHFEQIIALADARGLIDIIVFKQSGMTVVGLTAHGFSTGLNDEQITA